MSQESQEIRDVIKKTVHETLISLGWNVKDPQSMQANMLFLDNLRKSHERSRGDFKRMGLGIIIPGLAIALWEGFKSLINK